MEEALVREAEIEAAQPEVTQEVAIEQEAEVVETPTPEAVVDQTT